MLVETIDPFNNLAISALVASYTDPFVSLKFDDL